MSRIVSEIRMLVENRDFSYYTLYHSTLVVACSFIWQLEEQLSTAFFLSTPFTFHFVFSWHYNFFWQIGPKIDWLIDAFFSNVYGEDEPMIFFSPRCSCAASVISAKLFDNVQPFRRCHECTGGRIDRENHCSKKKALRETQTLRARWL